MIENICKLVNDNNTVTDKNGALIWQKDKYLETWKHYFMELLNADPTYLITVTTREEEITNEQIYKIYVLY